MYQTLLRVSRSGRPACIPDNSAPPHFGIAGQHFLELFSASAKCFSRSKVAPRKNQMSACPPTSSRVALPVQRLLGIGEPAQPRVHFSQANINLAVFGIGVGIAFNSA